MSNRPTDEEIKAASDRVSVTLGRRMNDGCFHEPVAVAAHRAAVKEHLRLLTLRKYGPAISGMYA